MSERQPEPPEKARRNDDDPDVEGHKFRDPVEKTRLNDDDDEPDVEGHRFRGPAEGETQRFR